MIPLRCRLSVCPVLLLLAVAAAAQPERPIIKSKDKDKDPVAQKLPELKDPPPAIAAETSRLVFHVSPLSAKGLLSQQTSDALKALMQVNRGATIVKLRAFIAGTGDVRRVQTIVSETFSDKKDPVPALTAIQVGALPMEGAQVQLESISAGKKAVNPNGLAFFSGQRASTAAESVAQLQSAANAARVASGDMLQVTCFLSSLDGAQAAREAVARAFPAAASDMIQFLRFSAEPLAVCEGVGRRSMAGEPVAFVGGPAPVALVNTPKLVFTSAQMAFLDRDADLRLAFERLGKNLAPLGVSYKDVVAANFYPLKRSVEERLDAIASGFFPRDLHPAGTTLLYEGLPSLDASMAVEVIAAPRN